MQEILRQIWQWLKRFFARLLGLKSSQTSSQTSRRLHRKGERVPESSSLPLTDTDYEFLFSQLLEGVAHGWHEGRILKFFEQLDERGRQAGWIAWLERFGAKVLASPAPNQQLAARMMRLGELARSFASIQQIGETSYQIGRQLLTRDTGSVVWEYEGTDGEGVPYDTIDYQLPENDGTDLDAFSRASLPAEEEEIQTLTMEELLERLQEEPVLVAQIAQQLGMETNNPQEIIDALIAQFQATQSPTESQNPNAVEECFNQGLLQAKTGDLEGAIASWDKALEINPHLVQAWYNRGSALGDLNRLSEAIASFDRAIELQPNDHKIWTSRGNAFYNLQRWEEAISNWDKAIELHPNSPQVLYNQGCACENLGRVEEAIASFRKVLEIEPNSESAQSKLSLLLGDNNGKA